MKKFEWRVYGDRCGGELAFSVNYVLLNMFNVSIYDTRKDSRQILI